jgi:hypothetical protein
MPIVVGPSSFFDKLESVVYLKYVLKVLGIVLFALGMFKGWHQVTFFTKAFLFTGPIAWFVGARFDKIYK